jgi:hypothetical protein
VIAAMWMAWFMWRLDRRGAIEGREAMPVGEAADVAGDAHHGGGHGLCPARLQAAPYAQQIVPLVAQAMNSLIRLTEVERLAGVDAAELMTGPPVSEELFHPDLTKRLLLLTCLA